ncbi:acyltransferase [Halomonas sp. HK25]|uniref:acyltransferase n=1 Tax=Halomonas sp. HK25 TaxID=3394321 RepID=UPI0039FC80DF
MKTSILFLISLFLPLVPSTKGFAFKRTAFRFAGANVGKNVRIVSSVKVLTLGALSIEDNSWVGHNCLMIGGDSTIRIGKNCDIAPRVTIATGSHRIDLDGEHVAGAGYSLPIEIGHGCWIGTGAILLGGAKIGHHSIVAAGAVVRGEFPPYSLIGGVPAKVIKKLRAQ